MIVRIRHVDVAVRTDGKPDRLALLRLRHVPVVQEMPIAIEVLNVCGAINDKKRIVLRRITNPARVNNLALRRPFPARLLAAWIVSPQPISSAQITIPVTRATSPCLVLLVPNQASPDRDYPDDHDHRGGGQRGLDHGIGSQHVHPGHEQRDQYLRLLRRQQHRRGYLPQRKRRDKQRPRRQHRPGERPDNVPRTAKGSAPSTEARSRAARHGRPHVAPAANSTIHPKRAIYAAIAGAALWYSQIVEG